MESIVYYDLTFLLIINFLVFQLSDLGNIIFKFLCFIRYAGTFFIQFLHHIIMLWQFIDLLVSLQEFCLRISLKTYRFGDQL